MDDLQELEHFDQEMQEMEEPPPRKPQGPAYWPIAAFLLIALVGVGVYLGFRQGWWRSSAEPPAVAQQAAEPTVPRAPTPASEPLQLPALDVSDAVVRTLVSRLSSHPRMASWLASDELVRRFAVAVANLAEGTSPRQHLPFMAPEAEYGGVQAGQRVVVDPQSYRRYDLIAEAFGAVDTDGAVRLYRDLYPLMEEAYRDLGYPAGGFDEALRRAFRELLATPMPSEQVELVARVTSFEYADPELESLSSARKQFLRMGPRNVARIQAKLRELGWALGFEEAG